MERVKISFGKYFLLNIVTFGIYAFYYRLTRIEYILDLLEAERDRETP